MMIAITEIDGFFNIKDLDKVLLSGNVDEIASFFNIKVCLKSYPEKAILFSKPNVPEICINSISMA